MLVAVYGTLKQGHPNYQRLLPGEEPLFRGFVRLPYSMFANGEYPMLVPADGPQPIHLEVFEVDQRTLGTLDALEAPYGYLRVTIHLEALRREVEIYLHPAPAPPGFSLVASGEWTG